MAYHTFFTKTRRKREAARRHKNSIGKTERAKTGFEVEFLIVDSKGNVSNEADKILSHIKDKKLNHEAVPECCHSYVEMGVYPRIYVRNVASKFLKDMAGVLDVAEKYDLGFFPLAMYPYKYQPRMRTGGWYGVKEKIFRDKWEYAGRCAGFHLHYSLPKAIFGYDDSYLERNAHRTEKQKTINSFNFGIAADPAMTSFTQSSPIYQGKYLAKDSRILLYRGGAVLGYDGMYSDYQLFGALQPYVITYNELIKQIEKRFDRWGGIVRKAGGDVLEIENKNKLDISWNPVKINKVGSIEMRNMDMNLPSTLMAVSILVKYALRDIQREEIEIVQDNLAIEHPFKFESGKTDKIYIPPFWYVNTILQKEAAWNGFESDAVYNYCKNFFSLCLRFTNKKYYPVLKPIKDMLRKRQTRSDNILEKIKARGYDPAEEIPEEILREIVIDYSSRLRPDIEKTEKIMGSLTEGDRVWL